MLLFFCFFFKQKTAYEMRISDWSSDVCSSDLIVAAGGQAVAAAVDVSDADSVAAMVALAERALGGIDILFNNAGVMLGGDNGPEDTEQTVWDRTIAVNLTGVFHCCRHGLTALRPAGGGATHTMSSIDLGSAVGRERVCRHGEVVVGG